MRKEGRATWVGCCLHVSSPLCVKFNEIHRASGSQIKTAQNVQFNCRSGTWLNVQDSLQVVCRRTTLFFFSLTHTCLFYSLPVFFMLHFFTVSMDDNLNMTYITLDGYVELHKYRCLYFLIMFTVYILILIHTDAVILLLCVSLWFTKTSATWF